MTAAIALPVVQGPRSREFLKSIVQEADLNTLKFFYFTQARIGETELILSRTGYTGELGYELYTPAEEAGPLWQFLMQQGRAYNLKPYGVSAMQTLRLEKGFPLYGNDVNEEVTPFHVGLERWIHFEKRDFIGREALLRVREQGLEQRWVGLTLESEVPANVNDKVFSVADVGTIKEKILSGPETGRTKETELPGDREIGHITASGRGHTVGQVLAMAYVDTHHAWPGNRVLVQSGDRPILATLTPTPFFDPQGARLRARPERSSQREPSRGQGT
jgi:aminomethyltransferase